MQTCVITHLPPSVINERQKTIDEYFRNPFGIFGIFAILLHLKLDPYIANGRKQPKSFDPALEKDLMGGQSAEEDDTMLCKRVVTKDRRYITQITCFEKGTMTKEQENSLTTSNRNAMRLPVFGKQQNGGALASLFSFPRRQLFGGTSIVKTFQKKN